MSEQAAVAFVAVSATNLILTFSEVRTGPTQTICMKLQVTFLYRNIAGQRPRFGHAEQAYASHSQTLEACSAAQAEVLA